jgi:hypothetical protein
MTRKLGSFVPVSILVSLLLIACSSDSEYDGDWEYLLDGANCTTATGSMVMSGGSFQTSGTLVGNPNCSSQAFTLVGDVDGTGFLTGTVSGAVSPGGTPISGTCGTTSCTASGSAGSGPFTLSMTRL